MSSVFQQSGRPLSDLIEAVEAFEDTAPVARAMAHAGEALVRAGFSSSRAPDGTSWAPLKRHRPGGGPLWKRGDLRIEASVPVIQTDGFVMTAPNPKSVHQRGYRPHHLPARPFYPAPNRLPIEWERVLAAAAEGALKLRLP